VAEDSIGGIAGALASVVHHLLFLDSFCVLLGIFLLIYGIVDGNQPAILIGTRAVIFGFGLKRIHSASLKDFEWYVGVVLLAVAVLPSHYFLAVYAYLK
jgi:hypothetical protein